MADTVKVGGKHVSKWVLWGGIGVVVVGGVLYLRGKGSSSSSSSTAQTGTDPVTGLPYSMDNQVDPASGMTYLAEAQQYGSVSAAEAAVSGGYGGVSGASYGASGLGYGGIPSYVTGDTSNPPNVYATNAQWAQAVEAGLTALGYSSTDVAAALGRYLGNLSETADQATIVQAAVAEYGPPPVGSYQIIQQSSSPGPTGGGTTTTPPPPPPPAGGTTTSAPHPPSTAPHPASSPPSPVAWVAAQWVNSTSTNVHWPKANGATSYQVRVTYQSQVVQTHTTSGENYTITGLTPDHTYGIHVCSIKNGQPWAPEASTSVHTPK